jgi:hypothetical protein
MGVRVLKMKLPALTPVKKLLPPQGISLWENAPLPDGKAA